MAKEATMMSVVTLPLKVEKWQADIINKRFELCRQVYNAALGFERKKYHKMIHDPRWIQTTETIRSEYEKMSGEESQSENGGKKRTKTQREAFNIRNGLLKEYGFSNFTFTSDVTRFYKHFNENISSKTANLSIAQPLWSAFEKLLFGNGKDVHFKKAGDWSSVASDGKSGIRMVNETGRSVLRREGNEKLYVSYGTSRGKTMTIPIVIPKGDLYAAEMIARPLHVIRLTRKLVRGTFKYFVQLTVDGAPAVKFREDTGEIIHTIGNGAVGVYIDTTSVTCCTKDGIKTFVLHEGIVSFEEERSELMRYMDTSRHMSNPENFNEDGTVKKGITKDGVRQKLHWKYSKNYKKAKAKLSNLYRVEQERREIQRNILANQLLELGDVFVFNDYPFQAAATRKKEDVLTSSGAPASKKKAGKRIALLAPAEVVVKVDQKLKNAGYDGVTKVKLKGIEYTEGYREKYAEFLYKQAQEAV